MTVAMSLMDPGPSGWVVGALMVAAGVRLLLGVRRRRRARRAALVAATRHPSRGPRAQWEAATMLLPLVCDQADATMVIPRQREARGA